MTSNNFKIGDLVKIKKIPATSSYPKISLGYIYKYTKQNDIIYVKWLTKGMDIDGNGGEEWFVYALEPYDL